jgi:hypothetical protein
MSTQFEEKHVLACNFPRHVTKFQGKVTVKITHHLDIIFTGGQGGRKSALMWWPNMPLSVMVFLLLHMLNCTNNHLKLFTYSIKCYLCLTDMSRSARERDICYFSVICCALEFPLKRFHVQNWLQQKLLAQTKFYGHFYLWNIPPTYTQYAAAH